MGADNKRMSMIVRQNTGNLDSQQRADIFDMSQTSITWIIYRKCNRKSIAAGNIEIKYYELYFRFVKLSIVFLLYFAMAAIAVFVSHLYTLYTASQLISFALFWRIPNWFAPLVSILWLFGSFLSLSKLLWITENIFSIHFSRRMRSYAMEWWAKELLFADI